MSNRRVKSLALDDDVYDEYDEDDVDDGTDELTEEDKEQLRLGTAQVWESLGQAFPTTDNEIQEALWNYYYDVGKSVTYLKNKHKPANATPKKQQPEVKKVEPPHQQHGSDGPEVIDGRRGCASPFSATDFFHDCPWLQVPLHRQATIIEHPVHPRPGLLGGASKEGKMSKLAVLATKRRQKESGRSSSGDVDQTASKDRYAETLSKLRISQQSRRVDHPAILDQPDTNTSDIHMDNTGAHSQETTHSEHANAQVDVNLRARPSAFASILVGDTVKRPSPSQLSYLDYEVIAKTFDFTEPSPDDVVNKAQNAKAPVTNKAKPKDIKKNQTDVNSGITNLSVQDSTRIKSKNLDVVAEYAKVKRKNAANFVVIGHVDAGKSTLMGRLLFDLKAVDQRTMDKYKQEAERIGKGSFAFAWVLDQGTEERARGVTIDIATNKFETDETSFTILDAPGHRDFVPNMIAGASQADFAVLVIDASTGNFESGLKGQTKEHALLVRAIGVQKIIVAVNKMDAAEWSKDRFDEIQQQISAFLTTAGFQAKNVSFVPCSGLQGSNILHKPTDSKASWYTGGTLVQELEKSEPTTHALDKPLRMTIGDVFRGSVQNPLSVSGRIEAGNVQVGEQVIIMPSGEKAYIKSLEVDDEPGDWAVAGQNVIFNLTDIDPIHLKTGDVLCSTASPIQNVSEFKAKILAFDHLTPMSLDVHRGRLHVPARISQLLATLDKSTGEVVKKKPKIVQPGTFVRVLMQLDQAVPLEASSRIICRANGETVGAGFIID